MNGNHLRRMTALCTGVLAALLLTSCASTKQETSSGAESVSMDPDGTMHLPAISVPFSALASDAAKANFIDYLSGIKRVEVVTAKSCGTENPDMSCVRQVFDDQLMRPGVSRLRAVFPVSITPEMMGGVQTDVVLPEGGVAAKNEKRVLINLHGGGLVVGARYGGQQESIPIASLGKIKVITVDYRMAPEHRHPAATEDVASVYNELLKHYRPQDIGIYGCSAGAWLSAASIAWFQTHDLPRPGAVGMFGAGGEAKSVGMGYGDSLRSSALLMGTSTYLSKSLAKDPYFQDANMDDPLITLVNAPEILQKFPPSLLMSGTRDVGLSTVVYTHAQLVKAGVEADLHVWEGAAHCSFAQPVVDPSVPETREAWDVIVKFFDSHLGK